QLYAFRALDYLQIANENDRRYLLFCAVQKAKVSTEGVKVMSMLSECIGAKGFESETYFESALRDIQLIPALEGSTHVNYAQTAQFLAGYLLQTDKAVTSPASLLFDGIQARENPYLMKASTGGTRAISFGPYLRA